MDFVQHPSIWNNFPYLVRTVTPEVACLGPEANDGIAFPGGEDPHRGDGSLEYPFLICTKDQMRSFQGSLANAHFELGQDIDLGGSGPQIGPSSGITRFDGRGHKILNVGNIAFGETGRIFGVVEDLHFVRTKFGNVEVLSRGDYGGAVFSRSTGTAILYDLDFQGSLEVQSGGNAGGLGGYAENVYLKDVTIQDLRLTSNSNPDGGLFVSLGVSGFFYDVRVMGSLDTSGQAGGLIGDSQGALRLDRVHVEATVQATAGSPYLGGLVGQLQGDTSIYRTQVLSSVSGAMQGVGGMIGVHSSGEVLVSDSFVRGTVTGGEDCVGGFIGQTDAPSQVAILRSYYSGVLTGPQSVGGLVGCSSGNEDATAVRAYWDETLSPGVSSFGGEGKTSTFLKDSSSLPSDWNLTRIWNIDPARNGGFPFIRDAP
jgi:hypothetical protein